MKSVNDTMIGRLFMKETAFQDLMQKRVSNILLIATPYDAFMLEEDGRVEEQVYNEYVSLNLSSPPRFTKVANYSEAYMELSGKDYDLIIAMPGVDLSETFREAAEIDRLYPHIPFVVLTPFSKEVRRRIANEDLRGVDYVFSWLGNVDLILAIIKLIEDRMNADTDINEIGVQAILFVEDSIRFYSAILPYLFKFLLKQSMLFSTEALNEHESMLRMRGRCKVLFARDYEEATALIDKYGDNIMGLVTDSRFPREGEKDPVAGHKLARYLHKRRPYAPVIMESQESENRAPAEEAGYVFLDKSSKTLPIDLRKAVSHQFGFGDFVVKYPGNGREQMRIHNLKELQHKIFEIPDDLLFYYCSSNCISRWLYSRALFPIADVLRRFVFNDMADAPKVRQLVFECIVRYRRMKNRGVVATFHKELYDDYSNFARMGEGSMGGKGRGLAFIDQIIKHNPVCDNFDGVQITIPHTLVICTGIFDEFMDANNLYAVGLSDLPDSEILRRFLEADFKEEVKSDIRAFYDVVKRPLAVRSSSLLEDSHYQPFAGIYSTYMVPYGSDEASFNMLCDAVKAVYASVFYKDSKAYMNATSNVIDQEKMAVILQGMAGEYHNGYYYPSFAGVGRSLNYYPIGDESTEEGIVEVAAGLGSYIVDGSKALRFSPAHPDKVLQTSTMELALRDTQTYLHALPAESKGKTDFTTDDSFNIVKLPVKDAFESGALKYLVSTFDAYDRVIRDNEFGKGRKLVTFANVLRHGKFPLARIVGFMLATGQYEMGRPVEIEFAGNINAQPDETGRKGVVYWLQIRPIVDSKEMLSDSVTDVCDEDVIIRSDTALGHGMMDNVRYVVYVKPQNFDRMRTRQIAARIGEINERLTAAGEGYVLTGPGRWGTSDPSLGIPVRWAQVAGARVIVETALPGYRIEPSQGTHFFQNLTSFGTAYFTVDPGVGNGFVNTEYLDSLPAEEESEFVRVVKMPDPLTIAVNGRKSKGVVMKPGAGGDSGKCED
ncbi:MAG: phosphoenolpyruvate synthase [Candidatus Amulumruptor caecigallinarius]|nr:phosphoenolpyruvate synthase [Candidatus Amulumruptor caecigallinarius]